MENKKYRVNTIIRRFVLQNSGRWTNYGNALSGDERKLLEYARLKGYVVCGNDAVRGGKLGEHFKVVKYFTTNSLLKKQKAEEKEQARKLESCLKSERLNRFTTISNIGCIVVDDVKYSNFDGVGENIVDVCSCDFEEFKKSEIITRRQIFNIKEFISVIKFDSLKSIKVSHFDCDDSLGSTTIDNVCGFCIWKRKMKVFVQK